MPVAHPKMLASYLPISSAFRPAAIKRALDQPRFEVMREKAAQEKAADRELKRAVAVTVRSLLRKSASFLSAFEPVLGIVDRIRGHAGRPRGFTSVHTAVPTGCALIGLLASRAACAYRNL